MTTPVDILKQERLYDFGVAHSEAQPSGAFCRCASIYMLQVFDRVLASRGNETLAMLGLLALLALFDAPWLPVYLLISTPMLPLLGRS